MKYCWVDKRKILDSASLSVEHWLSDSVACDGPTLGSIATVFKGGKPKQIYNYSIDTNGANNGLLQLINYKENIKNSTTHKKVLLPGFVAISRLRTYLRQVVCFSKEVALALDIEGLTVSSEFIVLKGTDCSPYFLTLLLLHKDSQSYLVDCTSGGHHPRVNEDVVLNIPTTEAILSFARTNENLFKDSCIQYAKAQIKLKEVFS